jgi:hypothetical protein
MNSRHITHVKASGFAVIVAVTVIGAADAAAQQPPPIHGVTGTIATETSIEETTAAGHGILAKVKRALHLNGRTTVPSGDAAGAEALGGLKKGTRVVVHDTAEGVKQIAGSIVALNLADRTISVRLSDDSIQTLRLSDEAAADAKDVDRASTGANVIVYYRNESGQRVAKHFKRVS